MQSSEALVGTEIRGYRIERLLGAGGMGQVWIARHTDLPELVRVVKTLLPEYARVPQIRDRFYDEARIVSRFDHDNIISVENFGALPTGELFLIMPLLDGRPLDEVLRMAGKLGTHHALTIAAQIGNALQYAHARGVVHRDLKPGNVFLEPRKGEPDRVKLLDFGIAKDASTSAVQKKTHAGMAMGTPSYMACEQTDDAASVGPAADIFALGVMLVEILTGQLPWGINEPAVTYHLQKTQPPRLTAEIPRGWVPILLAALSPEPSKRPPSARALIIALANELPALPPIWKSGAQIVKDVAADLIADAPPDDETVRAKGNAPLSAIPIYPSVGRTPSAPMPASHPASAPAPAYAAPSMPATANERPGGANAPVASQPTTLSASNGVSVAPAQSAKPRSGMRIALVLGVVALGSAVTFGVVLRDGHRDEPASSTRRAESNDAGVAASAMIDAQVQGTAPMDATVVMGASIDAATSEVAPVDASVDAATKRKSKERRGSGSSRVNSTSSSATNNSSKPSTSRNANTPSSAPPTGSATPRKFDPNSPLGED